MLYVRLAVSNPSVPVGLLSLEEKLVELANLEEMFPLCGRSLLLNRHTGASGNVFLTLTLTLALT